ncbi:hypothetical protein [Nocardioides sp. P86]|uniref:hypothetical protein n=1 Tax=Nocardioides sp. P86 TaxID=2939569 RepID=UPI00203E44A1|nr:hypothetical protein [Nocardioides sp. P86]MCM3515473.1 hypothetical protein [Nocardioides sp. P86]
MGVFGAVALPRVSKGEIERVLGTMDRRWDSVSHVTATTTLTRGIRDSGALALPVATLVDLLVLPGLPGALALPLDDFPGPAAFGQDRRAYNDQVGAWQTKAKSRRLRIGIQVDDLLRQFVREQADNPSGRALVASRREFARTVHALVNAGVDPRGLQARDVLGQVAARAWEFAEDNLEALRTPRDLLWVEPDDLTHDATPDGTKVAAALRSALRTAFGDQERWTLVHHGFYFYTPPQWAMFQLLRALPEVDQVFVVHDDGTNPAFKSWRHYFCTELNMPVPRLIAGAETVTGLAADFRGVLTGQGSGTLAGLDVRECRSATELVRLWQQEDERHAAERAAAPAAAGESAPGGEAAETPVRIRYAAAAKDVERLAQRLGRAHQPVDARLGQLPVGTFLMGLHGCIRQETGGRTSVELDGSAMLDIVTSGFLDVAAPPRAAVLRRALPYFEDCRTGDQWVQRAELLATTVRERVAPLGAREDGTTDVERLKAAAANPARLAPWADLSVAEAVSIERAVRRVVVLVEEITVRERITLGDHLGRVRDQLRRALASAAQEERDRLEDTLRGFSVQLEDEIDVAGLVDVVAMLLGREASTAREETEPDGGDDDAQVQELRGLDVLALERSTEDLHLANLAEDVFPSRTSAVGWPFDVEDLLRSDDQVVQPVVTTMLTTRASTGALGDLYLFWVALDGASPGRSVTLSWQSDVAADRRRLSPLVALLTLPDVDDLAIRQIAGGMAVAPVVSAADRPEIGSTPVPREVLVSASDLDDVVTALDRRAVAAAKACPRRFALQWALGPSAGFGPEFLQTMLYGNLAGALEKVGLASGLAAAVTANDLWPHLTTGQRRSTQARSVVKKSGGARPEWLLTLAGGQNGTGPADRAYQAAYGGTSVKPADVVPAGSEFLPPGVDDAKVCTMCPVQSRCSQRKKPER